MIKNFKWLLLVSLSFVACNSDDAVINPDSSDGMALTAGSANFSKYVALGDSFAAGYSDGALFIKGQEGAYPNIMAQQFALVGGGAFTTPLMSDNIGGFSMGGFQIPQFGTRLYFNGVGPVPVAGPTTTSITAKLTGQFNNMGIPGAKSFHLVTPDYAAFNPYFGRFVSSTGTTVTVLADGVSQNATFFSLWIGGNDVLTYATSGGIGVNQINNINAATYGPNDITNPTIFAGAFNALVTGLTAKGAKGVVANLPYVSTLPFFTTVPTNPIPLDAATAATLNGLFGSLNALFASLNETKPRFATLAAISTNPLLIIDETLEPRAAAIKTALTPTYGPTFAGLIGDIFSQARHASNVAGSKDYILLTSRGVLGKPVNGLDPNTTVTVPPFGPFSALGVSYPLLDRHVLTADEALQVKVATDAFNVTIQSVAGGKGLAFVDTKVVMDKLGNGGITANGYTVTSAYVTGGAFSLDGVHPSPRGYALIANKFIEAINMTYGSNLKGVDLSNYRILFPKSL
jgi:hypothetical protein